MTLQLIRDEASRSPWPYSPSDLSGSGDELCDRALKKLVDFRPFEIAEKALTENIVALERLRDRDPEQAQALEKLKLALTDLREGIPATQQMLQERCRTRDLKKLPKHPIKGQKAWC